MKRHLLFVIFTISLLLIVGCSNPQTKEQRDTNLVIDNNFPQIMVGVWEAETDTVKWGIKFEPDGSISKVIHFLAGPVDLAESAVTMEGPDPGTYAVFTMGPCVAKYDKNSQVLKAEIILDYYEMQLPSGNLRGRVEDYISGPISGDGKIWETQWISYGWLEGASPPDINEINANPEKLVFIKKDLTKKPD